MSDMVSRWPIRIAVAIEPTDLDADARLTADAIERCFAHARAAYFERCESVDIASLRHRGTAGIAREPIPGCERVAIAVNVTEVFTDRFTMAARIRADDGALAADARCSMSPGPEVPIAMRDEFIALAHAASYTH
jgi:acyl-CoA thioesterase FadM